MLDMSSAVENLSFLQVGLAALLILINGAVSLLLRLGLGRRLVIAAARAITQLLLLGLVLQWVFALDRWYLVVALLSVMAMMAGIAAVQRTERRHPGIWLDSVISVWASSWLIAATALFGIIHAQPWYAPQYTIPFLGMILGNTLNGISLGVDRLSEELVSQRERVETLLALGANRWEAARSPIRRAVRTGMIPILNSMVTAGLISVPGMMTGQLLAGANPLEAAKYQIMILFLIASATALGTMSMVLLSYRRLFNARHQFLYQRITARR
jgi:putative ABC transport system permease protein